MASAAESCSSAPWRSPSRRRSWSASRWKAASVMSKRQVLRGSERSMLEIKNLHATVDGKPILNGIDLTIEAGEVHAMMGPNGSGKSTLSYEIGRAPCRERVCQYV